MLFKSIIFGSVVAGAIGIFVLKRFLNKSKNINPKLSYSVCEHDIYDIKNPARIYKYSVPVASFVEIEQKYKRDLLGNYKKKEHIDATLQQYLKTNIIYQKRVIINTEGWVGEFCVDTNVNPKTLVFDIDNNSLEESKNDGLNRK